MKIPDHGVIVTVSDDDEEPIALRAGVIDDAARSFFRGGQCNALALALSERSGRPVHFLADTACVGEPFAGCRFRPYADILLRSTDGSRLPACPCQMRHVGVRRPDGAFVDIGGAVPMSRARKDFGADVDGPASPMLLADLRQGERDWFVPQLEVAHRFAISVLASLEKGI